MTIYRINPIGLQYTLTATENDTTLAMLGPKVVTLDMPLNEVNQAWYNWQMKGQLLQDAFKKLSADQREFLLTGITPDEWTELFSDTEEN